MGKFFYFAPELDSLTTKAISRVDCTSSNILFLTDSTFVEIVYCEINTLYLKGSYKIQNDSLIFNTSITLVGKEYLGEENKKTNGPEFAFTLELREEEQEEQTVIYKILEINNEIVLKNDARYGTIDEEHDYKMEIKKMKFEPIWNMLNP